MTTDPKNNRNSVSNSQQEELPVMVPATSSVTANAQADQKNMQQREEDILKRKKM